MILNAVYCLSDALASQVDIDLGPLRGRISKFNFEDHQGVRVDISSDRLSDLWGEQPSGRHICEGSLSIIYHRYITSRSFTFQPTLQASLQRKLPWCHQMSQTTLELIKKNKFSAQSTMDILSNCMVHPSKSMMKPSDLSNAPEPSADYIVRTANLFHASTPICNSEPLRTKTVYGLLRWLLAADFRLSVKASEEKFNRLTTEGDGARGHLLRKEDRCCGLLGTKK